MAYESTGSQALFPIYFSRMPQKNEDRELFDIAAAQNEANLNQDLEILAGKIREIESYLRTLE